jgi:hypothetical protein
MNKPEVGRSKQKQEEPRIVALAHNLSFQEGEAEEL